MGSQFLKRLLRRLYTILLPVLLAPMRLVLRSSFLSVKINNFLHFFPRIRHIIKNMAYRSGLLQDAHPGGFFFGQNLGKYPELTRLSPDARRIYLKLRKAARKAEEKGKNKNAHTD